MNKFISYSVLILLLVSIGFTVPQPVQAADKFMAVVITGNLPRYREAHTAFMQILEKGGMTADKVEVFVQKPNPDPMSWANSIRKAVAVGADVIVTYGAPASLVAQKQAKGIPVLFADVGDPVGLGLVKGLSTPGGDVTGVSSMTPIDTLLKNFISVYKANSVGIIYAKYDAEGEQQVKSLEQAASKYGFKVVAKEVKDCREVMAAYDGIKGKIDSLYLPHCAALQPASVTLLSQAAADKKPAITQSPGLIDEGALMALTADPTEQGQLVGVHALQVLNGQKAFTLPVRTPKKVSFVINLKAANKLGIKVPIDVLENATKVVK